MLNSTGFLVFLFYFLVVSIYGIWIYKRKRNANPGTKDYFLAEGSLTWWAIGASLIASNISAEQFIGMSGSGFQIGLAISSYEWMSAATLLVVAIFFIPVYIKNKIYTMPQFLQQRYNGTVAMIMAIFWLMLYIIVNLLSILYLGALAVSGISGLPIGLCISLLAIFAIIITLGGMKVIGYTDVVQVFFLIVGGLAATYFGLKLIAEQSGQTGIAKGFSLLLAQAPEHFHMILKPGNANYLDLPGISILIGGMWIANLNYWGCNQYITQRALGASIPTARKGLLFAAFLKLLMPMIVVLPGIAAFVLYQKGFFQNEMLNSQGVADVNKAYPSLLSLLPEGLKGLSFAALTAAIVASLAGKANSIATIFTLDIYKKAIRENANERHLVRTGKITIIVSMAIAVLLAFALGEKLMGEGKQGFQYIQEYTGFVSPGIFAMFLLGFFWKKTTSAAALFATIGGFVFSVFFKFLPYFLNLSFLAPYGFSAKNKDGVYEIPFLDRMAFVFIICIFFMYVISKFTYKKGHITEFENSGNASYKVSSSFAVGALIVVAILTALYTVFW